MPSTILVVTGEHNWTQRAMHLAGAMARETGAAVVILKMIRAAHLEYLGAGLRESLLPYEAFDALRGYVTLVESYGAPAAVEYFEYVDYTGGVLSAVEQLSALAVFAPAPTGTPAVLDPLRLWWLRRSLRCSLYTLGKGDAPLIWNQPPTDVAVAVARSNAQS
jgi:hypothetical protein